MDAMEKADTPILWKWYKTQNCLSYWYSILRESEVLVPKTKIIHTDLQLIRLWDHKKLDGYGDLIREITEAAIEMGFPCFLRTGQTSGKHDWKSTCYLESKDDVLSHVEQLAAFSDMVDLPTNVWVVRELIKTAPAFTAFDGDMPIVKEARCFIRDHKVQCIHPYWPSDAFKDQKCSTDNPESVQSFSEFELEEINKVLRKVCRYFVGYWSVDLLLGDDGRWWCTDMAQGDDSYHWKPCLSGRV